jgi:DNA-directed RNA polymerase subunit beta
VGTEAFGASNVLQEILTTKSDDVVGRAKARTKPL